MSCAVRIVACACDLQVGVHGSADWIVVAGDGLQFENVGVTNVEPRSKWGRISELSCSKRCAGVEIDLRGSVTDHAVANGSERRRILNVGRELFPMEKL